MKIELLETEDLTDFSDVFLREKINEIIRELADVSARVDLNENRLDRIRDTSSDWMD